MCDCDYLAEVEMKEDIIINAAQHGMKEHSKIEEDVVQMKEKIRALISSC